MSICICANVSADCPGQTALLLLNTSLFAARVPSSNTGRPQLDPAPQTAPTFWTAEAAHPWPGGCDVRGPPPRSSSWGPTCCRTPPARASAGSAGFGLSPVERPTGRGQQGARAVGRRKPGWEPRPITGRSLRGRGVMMEEEGGDEALLQR